MSVLLFFFLFIKKNEMKRVEIEKQIKENINVQTVVIQSVLDELINSIMTAMISGQHINFNNFGSFKLKKRAGKWCNDTGTIARGEPPKRIYIEPYYVCVFVPCTAFKKKIKQFVKQAPEHKNKGNTAYLAFPKKAEPKE